MNHGVAEVFGLRDRRDQFEIGDGLSNRYPHRMGVHNSREFFGSGAPMRHDGQEIVVMRHKAAP